MDRSDVLLRLFAFVLGSVLLLSACGGGGSSAVPSPPSGGNNETSQAGGSAGGGGGFYQGFDNGGPVPDPEGILMYDGRQPPDPPTQLGPEGKPSGDVEEDYGDSIVALPKNSAGEGVLVLKNFQPGQKVVLITTNTDPSYLNFSNGNLPGLPFELPDTNYSYSAVELGKITSSLLYDNPYEVASPEKFDVDEYPYEGIDFSPGETVDPAEIGRRELEHARETGFLDEVTEAVRMPSVLSKGIVRTFTAVPATIQMPPIDDPDDPQSGSEDFNWPWIYEWQDARLVGIGAHSYVFLSTEINNGYPDGVKFTTHRIQQFIKEFDEKIFPVTQAAFGPVRTYNEETIYFPPDRNLRLFPDDFEDEELIDPFDIVRDDLIEKDNRIIITIMNGVAPGGGGFYLSQRGEPRDAEDESPYEVPPEINYDSFSTVYLDPANFPANSDDWSSAYSVLAHEFQHKLHSDNVVSTSTWFNESLSMLAIHVNGYSIERGNLIGFLISQVESFMANPNVNSMFNDVSTDQNQGTLYAAWFLFMLYVFEHYGPGTINEFYTSSGDPIVRLENATGEPAHFIFKKWILANYIDGLDIPGQEPGETLEAYVARVPLADPRLRYATFDVKGRIGGSDNVLPGVKVHRFPNTEEFYPVISEPRLLKPWSAEYILFENGSGRDLRITVESDVNFKTFVLPVKYNIATTEIFVDNSVYIP